MANSCSADFCRKEGENIKNLLNDSPLSKGDKWYIVDIKWFKQWKEYVGLEEGQESMAGDKSSNPGPIDNSPLFRPGNELKEDLVEEVDFTLVPENVWNILVERYGIHDGQEPICRCVIDTGTFTSSLKVELYPIKFGLRSVRDNTKTITKAFSQMDTLETVVAYMKKEFNINESQEIRLWHKYELKAYEQLKKFDSTLNDLCLCNGEVLLIEEQSNDGSWPFKYGTTGGCNSYDSYTSNRPTVTPGLCGLGNLGNTCFMNSAIQCMSNVPALTEYMISDKWKKDLNKENPLGMRGEIALSYVELIKNMWSGKCSSTSPRSFKIAVGRFKPEFSGYQQQDSQELMAFLLDGLHEDLNRIRKKPYIETKEADNRPDDVVAKETWRDYTLRNNSVIVDIFHGLLKSTLVCPECTKVSVKFDPFCYLSVPLPVKKERQLEVIFVPHDPKKRFRQCKVSVPKLGSIADLCNALSAIVNVPAENLVVADVYNHRFHKVFAGHDSISHIAERDDIFVYQVPVTSPDDKQTAIVPLYLREISEKRSTYHSGSPDLFGQPLLVAVPRKNCTYDIIYERVMQRLSRYVRQPADNEWPISENGEDCTSEDNEGSETDNGTTDGNDESNVDSMDGDSDMNGSADDAKRIFKFRLVNSYGNTEITQIKDDSKSVTFPPHSYLAADWSSKAKELFYNSQEAELIDTDHSMELRSSQKKAIHLKDCIDLFTNVERLGEHDPWYCPDCKKHQQATKKFDIWDLPSVLVIHLKRFSYCRYWRDKLDTFVDYPVKGLDMSDFVINPNHNKRAIYDLIAVANHYGGMGGGHYTAYAKNKITNRWFYFDDSSVSTASEDSVVTKAGYVLVYQRRDSAAPPDGHNGEDEEMDTD